MAAQVRGASSGGVWGVRGGSRAPRGRGEPGQGGGASIGGVRCGLGGWLPSFVLEGLANGEVQATTGRQAAA